MKPFKNSLRLQIIAPSISLLLCLAITFIFRLQPDAFAAVLVLPRWLWIVPGLLFAALGWTRQRGRFAYLAALLWMLYALFFVQEFRRLVRWKTASDQNADLRVISLNCNGGNEAAAAEVKDFHPDLVFFEESPLRPLVQKMATNLLGTNAESFCSSDVSLIAKGHITPLPVENSASAPFIHARVEFPSGLVAEVFVVRLQPYNIRADLWSPDCWQKQSAIRKIQRSQFEWIEREVEKVPKDVPIILGGDFNLPAGDKLFRILNPRLRDTFRETGGGWGDTLDNNLPILRIDQIWCDSHFKSAATFAQPTANSDHRMVICDLSRSP